METPGLTPQLVESDTNRGAIEPSFRVVALYPFISRQSEEHFDSEFLGSCWIADHSHDNGRNTCVVGAKKCVQVEIGFFRTDVGDKFTWCVHNWITPLEGRL